MRRRILLPMVAAAVVTVGALPAAADASGSTTMNVVRRGPDTLVMVSMPRPHAAVHGAAPTSSDFDGDGVDDLAVTADASYADQVWDRLGDGIVDGSVLVTYSSTPREDAFGVLWPTTRTSGFNSFGMATAAGDFDRDGYDDLVIGDLDDSVDGSRSHHGTGAVWILYGSKSGLQLAHATRITQDTAGVPGRAEAADWFGFAVASGDIDGDGYDDVAVGAPNEKVGSHAGAGAVTVLRGSRSGVTGHGARTITQDTPGIPGRAEREDEFGRSLAIGRIGTDRYADLVVGAPSENVGIGGGTTMTFCNGCTDGTGALTVVRGSAHGLDTRDALTVGGGALARRALASHTMGGNTFLWRTGSAVAVGDVDGDGRGEVVVAVPAAQVGAASAAGAVVAIAGGRSTVELSRVRVVTRASAGVAWSPQSDELLGTSLAVGDLTGDGRADIVVGSERTVAGRAGAGAVTVLRGARAGLTGAGSTTFSQAGSAIPGSPEKGDTFGSSVRIASTDGRGRPEVVIASGNEAFATNPSTGSITTVSIGTRSVRTVGFRTAASFVDPAWVPWLTWMRLGD